MNCFKFAIVALRGCWGIVLGITLSIMFCCRGEEIRYCTDKERAANSKGVIAFREGMRAEVVNLIKSLTDV